MAPKATAQQPKKVKYPKASTNKKKKTFVKERLCDYPSIFEHKAFMRFKKIEHNKEKRTVKEHWTWEEIT